MIRFQKNMPKFGLPTVVVSRRDGAASFVAAVLDFVFAC